jgi:tryptophan-rich sensory protein
MSIKNKTQSCLGQNICVDDSFAIDIIFKSIRYIILFIPLIIGMTIGAIYGKKWNEDKYKNLKKPEYNPPNYVFGIVWPILYLLIGGIYSYALYDSKCIPDSISKCAKIIYYKDFKYWIIPTLALIFNFLYIPVFFGENGLFNGFVIIILSLIFAILTLIQFITQNNYYKYTKIFAIIALVPYILWLSFASYLSYNIYILN